MRKVKWVLLILIFILLAASLINQPVASDSQEAPVEWREVGRWSGNGVLSTPTFTVGEEWRIRWSNRGNLLSVMVHEPGDEFPVALPVNTTSKESNDSYVYKAGTFYLQVNALGSWTIVVEEHVSARETSTSKQAPLKQSQKTVKATRFELLDSTGKVCAVFSLLPDRSLGIHLLEDTPAFRVLDKDGKPRTSFLIEGTKETK